eukprot:Amastigsp_a685808_125.p2 type:complete len:303 gc:universal Amastigsp_a685808_125:939-31(-)
MEPGASLRWGGPVVVELEPELLGVVTLDLKRRGRRRRLRAPQGVLCFLVDQLLTQPHLHQKQERRCCPRPRPGRGDSELAKLVDILEGSKAADAAVAQMAHVGCPRAEPVEDVRRVDDRRAVFVGLAPEILHEIVTADDVQIGRDLVEQKHAPRPHQPHQELHTAALAVAHGVHVPQRIDVQELVEEIAPRRELVAPHRRHEAVHAEVRPHNRVVRPLGSQECEPVGGGKVRVLPEHEHGRLDQVLARKDPEQRRFACAVDAHKQTPGTGGEVEVHVLKHKLLATVIVGEAFNVNCRACCHF